MLNIWYYTDVERMKDAPTYFNNTYEDEWLEDPFVQQMIWDVDKSKVISPRIIDSPVLGPITPRELSGGVKVLILLLKDNSWIYNISNCGDNCAKWILEIAKKKDLTVYLEHVMKFPEPFEIKLLNTNEILHTFTEYAFALYFAKEKYYEGEI